VTATDDGVIKLWSTVDCSLLSEVMGNEGTDGIALSPDDKVLATGTWWGDISFWDAASGERVDNGVPLLTLGRSPRSPLVRSTRVGFCARLMGSVC
jgi:WD40 repeat protein